VLASELLRRLVPSGTGFDVDALGALDVAGQTSTDGIVCTDDVAITGDLSVTGAGHFTGDLTMLNGTALINLTLDPANPLAVALPTGGRLVAFLGPTMNMATPNVAQLYPAMSGFYFQPMTARWRNVTTAGTISTAPTTRAGNDGANSNIVASSTAPTTADFAGALAPGHNSNLSPGRASEINLSTPINVEIQTGATGTGGFAWTARLFITGWLVPV
jgi:hypothetical protein